MFLDPKRAESELAKMRITLSQSLSARSARSAKRRLTPAALATQLRSIQSRVAQMEAGNSSVSLELLVRALLTVGATRRSKATAMTKRVAQRQC